MQTYRSKLLPALAALVLGAATAQPALSAAGVDAAPGAISIAQGTPQHLAAEQGLRTLIHQLAGGDRCDTARIFAVDNYQALRDATIGPGFQVNLVDPQALANEGNTFDATTYPSGEWRFVVLLADKPIGLITVARMHGQWQMVSAGASELAQEIMAVVSQYRNENPFARLRFIRSQQGVADFIEIAPPTTGAPLAAPRYIPLLSARKMLGHSMALANESSSANTPSPSATPLSEAQILPELRESVRRGMTNPALSH